MISLIAAIIGLAVALAIERREETRLPPTAPPTQMPTFSLDGLTLLLISVSPDEGNALWQENTAQNKAFQWIAGSGYQNLTQMEIIQRYTLATLFFSTSGERWFRNTYWLNDNINECNWYFTSENVCNSQGELVALDLTYNSLQGPLPREIGLLTRLCSIDLTGNSVSGSVPGELGDISSLSK
jgi:hypothetical protein